MYSKITLTIDMRAAARALIAFKNYVRDAEQLLAERPNDALAKDVAALRRYLADFERAYNKGPLS